MAFSTIGTVPATGGGGSHIGGPNSSQAAVKDMEYVGFWFVIEKKHSFFKRSTNHIQLFCHPNM
jgi:hypothetical protein